MATNAQIAPSLGRNLAAGANATVTVAVTAPYSIKQDRVNQLDLRFSKNLRVGRVRVQGMFDLYNALNETAVLFWNGAYGSAWQTPTAVLGARILKLGAQINF